MSNSVSSILRVTVCLLLLTIAVPAHADDNQWEQKIVGTWELDFEKTMKLWEKYDSAIFEDAESILGMIPLVPMSYKFAETGELKLANIPGTFTYQVEQRERDSSELVIKCAQESRQGKLRFTIVNDGILHHHDSASFFGPVDFVYRKVGAVLDERTLEEGLAGQLEGQWQLHESLTNTAWEMLAVGLQLDTPIEQRQLDSESIGSIRFERGRLYFEADKSVILLQQQPGESSDSSIVFQSRRGQPDVVEVVALSDSIIQLVVPERNLVAVYKREDANEIAVDEARANLPAGRLATTVIASNKAYPAREPLSERVEPIGIDGDVEINEVNVKRRRSSGAVVDADITNMAIELFIDMSNHPATERNHQYLVSIPELQPILDDTGRDLSPKDRRARIEMLTRPIFSRSHQYKRDGRVGPSVGMTFDAPGREAKSIAQLAGTIEVAPYTTRTIEFEDLRSLVGKELKHPLLNEMKIIPSIDDGEFPEVVIKTSGNAHRILRWDVIASNEEALSPGSYGQSGDEFSKGFDEKIPAKISLVLELAVPEKPKRVKFDFRDIELP